MGLLTLVNVSALILLSSKGFKLISDYRKQRNEGIKDPVFNKREIFAEEADCLEGWE